MKKDYKMFSSYLEFDLDNLAHNVGVAVKRVGDVSRIIAVVKANAYNHGVEIIAQKLYRCGVRHFAVANIDEALQLRNVGIDSAVQILGPCHPSRLSEASRMNISVTAESLDSVIKMCEFTDESGQPLKLHIALNTGMNRIGFFADGTLTDELKTMCGYIKKHNKIIPEGIFTHFCDADNSDSSFTDSQYRRFCMTAEKLEQEGVRFMYKHICNTAGTLKYSDYCCDKVRFGIGLYGCEFGSEGVKPILSFKTHVAQVFDVKKGEVIGYGRTYTAEKDMKIATVTVGYADGLNRLLSNKGEMLIHGKRVPIVGRICMDLTMVDVSDIPDVKNYDEVTIIGSDGGECITAEEHAEICDTISYEILCGVGHRSKKVYIENGNVL